MKSEVSSRYKQKTAKTGVEAMHEVLDEKQQHIEQLLKERDIERGEMMELHQAMSTTKMDYESLKNENSRVFCVLGITEKAKMLQTQLKQTKKN